MTALKIFIENIHVISAC